MKTIKHNIGTQLELPIEKIVSIKGRPTYIVKYGEFLSRVTMFSWQENKPAPKKLLCRLVSINEFGFPSFEQVAQQEEVRLIQPVKTSESKDAHKDQARSVFEKKDISLKQETPKESKVSKRDILNITSYRWSFQEEDFEKWFMESGGIKKRLSILISIAEQLVDYHRKNKVYKDFVPEYINIESSPKMVKAILPETNYYYSGLGNIFIYASHAAPEVVNRRMPNTPMSDSYSFAILVHELLAFCHPFIGDAVNEGKYSMDEAMRGLLPWIDDKENSLNRLRRRYYDRFFTTPEIIGLFRQTFEIGKEDPMSRPTMHQWLDALYATTSLLKHCPFCNTEFIYSNEINYCPFCEDEPVFPIAVLIQQIDKKFDSNSYTFSETERVLYPDPIDVLFVNKANKLFVNTRHLLANTLNVENVISFEIVPSDDDSNIAIVIEPLNGYAFYASTAKGERYTNSISKPTKILFPLKNPRKIILSLKPIDVSQRVLNVQINNTTYAEDSKDI